MLLNRKLPFSGSSRRIVAHALLRAASKLVSTRVLMVVPLLCLAAFLGVSASNSLEITTHSLSSGDLGLVYSKKLRAAGGRAPYTWSVKSGKLPGGLSLSGAGVLWGWPSATGKSSFTVDVTDADHQSASEDLDLFVGPTPILRPHVAEAGSDAPSGEQTWRGRRRVTRSTMESRNSKAAAQSLGLTIETVSLPSGTSGSSYIAALQGSGGTAPYTWALTGGQLAAGLSLAPSGIISGTPSAAGTYNFSIQMADAKGLTASAILGIVVAACTSCGPSLSISPSTLPAGTMNTAYAVALTANGGTAPYTWSVASGSLPPGLTLGTTGAISGTPTSAGTFLFMLEVADSATAKATQSYTVSVANTQALDAYGGTTAMQCAGGAKGVFYVEKMGNRWHLCTPDGNVFWLKAVYEVDSTDGGAAYQQAIVSKYPSGQWPSQTLTRLLSWGFNALGPQAGMGSHNMYPVSTYGAPPNPVKMPFIRSIDLSAWCMRNSTYKTKNLYANTNPAVYSIGRDFPDVFDPHWQACAAYSAADPSGMFTPAISKTEPYMIGTWIGDADYLFGFGRGPSTLSGSAHPNLGWIAATTAPTQTSGPNGDLGNLFTYTDPTVYTKKAWQTYVEGKYGTIEALNAAWGSDYTTFGSAGGWPKKTTGGTGLMDEDGSSPWVGNGTSGLTGASPGFAADVNTFLSQIADEYFRIAVQAVKAAYPNHLVFGPGSLNVDTYSQVLQKAGQYLDVVEVWQEPKWAASTLADAYNLGGKPLIVWTTLTASGDSSPGAGWGTPSNTCNASSDYDYTSQSLRGSCYQQLINNYLNATGADGSHPVVGFDWWEWTDKTTGGENENFGLVTNLDNAYNGREDIIAPGFDQWGFPTGGEKANYGDFIDAVKATNLGVYDILTQQ